MKLANCPVCRRPRIIVMMPKVGERIRNHRTLGVRCDGSYAKPGQVAELAVKPLHGPAMKAQQPDPGGDVA